MEILSKIHSFFVNRAYANSLGETLTGALGELEGTGISNENELVDAVVQIAVPLAVICLIVLVVYAAYMLMSSQGNPDKLSEGRSVLTNAIIGFLVILLSVAILLLISNTLGLDMYG